MIHGRSAATDTPVLVDQSRLTALVNGITQELDRIGAIRPKGTGEHFRRFLRLNLAEFAEYHSLEARQLTANWVKAEEAPAGNI
jgi:hypothetical protein